MHYYSFKKKSRLTHLSIPYSFSQLLRAPQEQRIPNRWYRPSRPTFEPKQRRQKEIQEPQYYTHQPDTYFHSEETEITDIQFLNIWMRQVEDRALCRSLGEAHVQQQPACSI